MNGRLMLSLGTLFLASHYLFASSQCLSTPLPSLIPLLSPKWCALQGELHPPSCESPRKIHFLMVGLLSLPWHASHKPPTTFLCDPNTPSLIHTLDL